MGHIEKVFLLLTLSISSVSYSMPFPSHIEIPPEGKSRLAKNSEVETLQRRTLETKALQTATVQLPTPKVQATKLDFKHLQEAPIFFDLPVSYNSHVSQWIKYFQGRGKPWFATWLERSTKYMPFIQRELKNAGLPQDLAYIVMIESGFAPTAQSSAGAVGPWQFMKSTAQLYGLKVNPWLDERRDLKKATVAATKYMRSLYSEFSSWYLVAASYNMGENALRRQVRKLNSHDFWKLAREHALPKETTEYVPKILAAMLISKAPSLYGFQNVMEMHPLEYEVISVPGGTELSSIADQLKITPQALIELNRELLHGSVPHDVEKHFIRIPKGGLAILAER